MVVESKGWTEETEVWQCVVKAIVDGHSCLPQESQEIILSLIRSGNLLASRIIGEFPDNCITAEEKSAIALFEGLEVGE